MVPDDGNRPEEPPWSWEPPGWCPEDWRLAYQRWRLPGEMEGIHQFLPVSRLCQEWRQRPK
ncbi:MAG: hypothetical protein OWU84_03910 [Firmicutes bacterium]|nr:hypothetical protein [Bacillota bacterium]